MAFVLKGRFSASVCSDCEVLLEGSLVRLYAAEADPSLAQRAAADPRHTMAILDDDAVAQRAGRLLGEGEIGAGGAFSVELGEGYEGGALDVDVYCGTIAGHHPPRPLQLSVTTVG
jgi:hypothetical protein